MFLPKNNSIVSMKNEFWEYIKKHLEDHELFDFEIHMW